MYPKYGKIKNYVYDKSVQDIHHNINMTNYPLYNATANNDYDSYPSIEEYKKIMKKTGQVNLAYAGGGDTTGIPMRGQMPIYANNEFNRKWLLGNEGNKTMYNPKLRSNFWNASSYRSTNNNSNSIDSKYNNRSFNDKKKENDDINRTIYKRQNSFTDFNNNLSMKNNNTDGINVPQNYPQTMKENIAI